MPKQKKNQLQPLLPQPQVPKREEIGDKDNGNPVGRPSPHGQWKAWWPQICPQLESTHMSNISRMDKLLHVHAMNGILHCNKNEQTFATGNLDESHKCHVGSKRSQKQKNADSFHRGHLDQGDWWFHYCWVSHLLPRSEAQFREA